MSTIDFVVGDMKTSAGMEYYVIMRNGDRRSDLYMFKTRGRAEFTAAELNYVAGNTDVEPDIMDYEA